MEDMPALSRKMTMLRYMDVRLYAMVLCLILGLTAALSGFLLERAAAQNYEEELASPVLFDASEPERYSYVRLQYLTDSFVEHVKSRNRYYFGFDFMFRPYIISMKGELPENLKELTAMALRNRLPLWMSAVLESPSNQSLWGMRENPTA